MMSIKSHTLRSARCLARNCKGAAITEFGFVAPLFMIILMGVFDAAHTTYTTSLLHGAMQKAGRDLTLEDAGSQESVIDARVKAQVQNVVPDEADIELEKLSHFEFEDIGEAEEFTDNNGDGLCNDGEPFEDANENGVWDANRGADGIGGARDAVLYTAIVTYDRMFPMAGLVGMPEQVELRASTVLRNQPYDVQDTSVQMGNCP